MREGSSSMTFTFVNIWRAPRTTLWKVSMQGIFGNFVACVKISFIRLQLEHWFLIEQTHPLKESPQITCGEPRQSQPSSKLAHGLHQSKKIFLNTQGCTSFLLRNPLKISFLKLFKINISGENTVPDRFCCQLRRDPCFNHQKDRLQFRLS